MAKKSAVNRNEAVKALVAKYAAKREALKATANDESLPLEERFVSTLKAHAYTRRAPSGGRAATLSMASASSFTRPSR